MVASVDGGLVGGQEGRQLPVCLLAHVGGDELASLDAPQGDVALLVEVLVGVGAVGVVHVASGRRVQVPLTPVRVDKQPLGLGQRQILLSAQAPESVRHHHLAFGERSARVDTAPRQGPFADVDVTHRHQHAR